MNPTSITLLTALFIFQMHWQPCDHGELHHQAGALRTPERRGGHPLLRVHEQVQGLGFRRVRPALDHGGVLCLLPGAGLHLLHREETGGQNVEVQEEQDVKVNDDGCGVLGGRVVADSARRDCCGWRLNAQEKNFET